jgi:hypothetical protein
MKKEYITPEIEEIHLSVESIMNTDSEGLDDDFCAKEQNEDFFDKEDNLWDYSTKIDIWER